MGNLLLVIVFNSLFTAYAFGTSDSIHTTQSSHANAGNVTLPTLIEEALKSNLEIQEAEKQYLASQALRRQTISGYLPEIGLDGGYQENRLDGAKNQGSFVQAIAKLNLYRGGSDRAEQEARGQEENFQSIQLAKTKVRIERELSRVFYELLFIQEASAVKTDALASNKTQMDLAIKKRQAGFTSQADVLEFELRESTLRSDINFLAREEVTKERQLRGLLGRLEGPVIQVGGHLHRITVNSKTETDLLTIARQERLDLKEAEKEVSISNLEYRSLLAEQLPKIDLEARYGKLATEDHVYDAWHNRSITARISIPLFSGLSTHYGRQSQAQVVAKSELKKTRLEQTIQIQLKSALARLKSVEERLDLEEKNIERSKQYYSITLSEYKKGVKNSPDMAGAAERLFDARQRNLEYRKELYLACLDIAEVIDVTGNQICPDGHDEKK